MCPSFLSPGVSSTHRFTIQTCGEFIAYFSSLALETEVVVFFEASFPVLGLMNINEMDLMRFSRILTPSAATQPSSQATAWSKDGRRETSGFLKSQVISSIEEGQMFPFQNRSEQFRSNLSSGLWNDQEQKGDR